ncbi:zinc ribbon domain-containing protein [Nonomuraea sp. NPDC049646]|uniref:zinc ribbon domain-containing protein n=1 Tax=unclassified Nonomuraea TaxID=2593643 RepID=UPI0037BDB47D
MMMSARSLLADGLLRCGVDGRNLHEHLRESGRVYVCFAAGTGCGGVTIDADLLDNHVAARVLGRFAQPPIRDRLWSAMQRRHGAPPDLDPDQWVSDLAGWWTNEATTTTERRELVMTILDHLTVAPAAGPDTADLERVTWHWR